jgi:hypothetical protein
LISDVQAFRLIIPIIQAIKGPRNDISILIPGVGKSVLGHELCTLGYRVVVTDVEQVAIDFQTSLFECTPGPGSWVILNPLNQNLEGVFDIIIDKSFLDVFVRGSGSQKMMKDILTHLHADGIYIVISMFHKAWKRLLGKSMIGPERRVLYRTLQSDPVSVPGKRVRQRTNTVAMLVAGNGLLTTTLQDFLDFNTITENDYPAQSADNC